MKNSTFAGIVGGIGAVVVALVVAAVAVPMLLISLIGGAVNNMAGAGAGLLADEEFSQCLSPSGNGSWGAVTATQEEYVSTVIGVAKGLGISERGQIVAVMVMLQESGIQSYANDGQNALGYEIGGPEGTQYWLDMAKLSLGMPHDAVGHDADSVGLFQQRASAGWANTEADGFRAQSNGTEAISRLMDPEFGALGFFGGPGHISNRGLLDVDGWESLPLTVAAQTVQGSAFPDAYAKWESQATGLVKAASSAPAIKNPGSGTAPKPSSSSSSSGGSSSGKVTYPMKEGTYSITDVFGERTDPVYGGTAFHGGLDMGAPHGTPIYAMADGVVAAAGPADGFGNFVVIDHTLNGKKMSSLYGHMSYSTILVKVGEKVTGGQQIAGVGTEGKSTGPHLHFEIWDGGRFDGGVRVDPAPILGGNFNVGPVTGGAAECKADSTKDDTASASGTAKAVLDSARSRLGVAYSWGGGTVDGPSAGSGEGAGIVGFDCSSLVQYAVYNGTGRGYMLPRTATPQYEATKGNLVAKPGDGVDKLQPGDLLFWAEGTDSASIYHVAMYVGEGQMIEAPDTGDVVKVTSVRLGDTFYGATRINYNEKKA